MTGRPVSRSRAWVLKGTVWAAALAVLAVAGSEAFLRWRAWREQARLRAAAPVRAAIEDACRGADTFHLHPQYLFFLPFTRDARADLSTPTCGLTPDGFRKPGPEARGSRQLAFLIGGSVAFSDMASSDAATLTSVLNRVQDQYFFVTAGVSGWNSSQALSRVAFQVVDYHPALVVALDGANDASLTERFAHRGDDWVGVPAEFDRLDAVVSARTPLERLRQAGEALLLSLTTRARMRAERAERAARGPVRPEDLRKGAARYVRNLPVMRDLVVAAGGRFVAVFQPMAQLHRKLDVPIDDVPGLDAFHAGVLTEVPAELDFHDFGRLFDGLLPVVHVNEGELTKDTVFVDDVHFHDRGNDLVAREIWKAVQMGVERGVPATGSSPAAGPKGNAAYFAAGAAGAAVLTVTLTILSPCWVFSTTSMPAMICPNTV